MVYTTVEKQRLEAWAEWLGRYGWAWYCHLTFKDEDFNGEVIPVNPKRAGTLFDRYRRYIGESTRYFWVLEKNRFTDTPHLHCLLGPCSIAGQPVWGYGHSKIEPFDSTRGGLFYISKELVRGAEFNTNVGPEKSGGLQEQVVNGI